MIIIYIISVHGINVPKYYISSCFHIFTMLNESLLRLAQKHLRFNYLAAGHIFIISLSQFSICKYIPVIFSKLEIGM